MKTELIADILQLDKLINSRSENLSYYTRASAIKSACAIAHAWNALQVKACNVPMTEEEMRAHTRKETHFETTLSALCLPAKVVFENLDARIVYDENREFYFPKLS